MPWDTYGFVSPRGNFADYAFHIAECLIGFLKYVTPQTSVA